MEIPVEKHAGAVDVAIMAPRGDIDASNYQELIAKAQGLYESGVRDLLIELGGVTFLSSSGLVALHSIAMLMRGEKPLDPEAGWDAIHSMEHDLETGIQKHVKLLNPQPRVDRTLERSGLKQYFEIYSDRTKALNSFQPGGSLAPAI